MLEIPTHPFRSLYLLLPPWEAGLWGHFTRPGHPHFPWGAEAMGDSSGQGARGETSVSGPLPASLQVDSGCALQRSPSSWRQVSPKGQCPCWVPVAVPCLALPGVANCTSIPGLPSQMTTHWGAKAILLPHSSGGQKSKTRVWGGPCSV